MSASLATISEVEALCASVDYFLLDIDGVIWSGEGVLPRVPEALRFLRAQHKQIRFISNNLIYSREAIARQFSRKGIDGVSKDEIHTVAYAAALYLQECFARECPDRLVRGNIFVVGGPGIHEEIRAVLAPGYTTYGAELASVDYSPDMVAESWEAPLLPAPEDSRVSEQYGGRRISLQEMDFLAVAVGLDFELNMTKLACAAAVLQCSAAVFVGTNPDPSDPAGSNHILLPASGAVLAAMTTALGRSPDVMCGKPSATMGQLLLEREQLNGRTMDLRRTVMIGDRLLTDIQFGKRIGARTALVLTGAQRLTDLTALQDQGMVEELPDMVLRSLADVLPSSAS